MEAKEYLSEVERLSMIINHKCNEVSEMRKLLDSIGSPNLQADKVSGGQLPGTGGLQKKVADVVTAEKELDAMIDEYNDFRKQVIKQIYQLSSRMHQKFLYKRYIEGKALRRIADEINRKYGYTCQLNAISLYDFSTVHKKFLKNFSHASYKLEDFR